MAIRKKIKKDGQAIPILEKYELLDRIERLSTIRDKALVAVLYLTGCRVSEVVHYIIEKNQLREINERKLVGHPILKKQIRFDGDLMLVMNVRTLKRKKYTPRTVPAIVTKEQEFVDIILRYLDTLDRDDPLFPISRQWAYNILSSVKLYPHYLRHLRSTHLVTEYGFSGQELKQFHNWATSKMADTYVHLNVKNLIEIMRRK